MSGTVCILITFFIMNIPMAVEAGASETNSPVKGARAVADHPLLSEVCVKPGGAEFIEIYNPTDQNVALDNYYLGDINDYYNIVNTTTGFEHQYATDFVASFPEGSVIFSRGYQIIAMNSSEFMTAYNALVPNYCLEGDDCPRMNGTAGFIGGSAGLTDDHETIVLFYWNGMDDLVKDVDIIWWGDDPGYRIDKTGIDLDSEFDGDDANSSYNNDASTYPKIATTHNSGNSFKRTNITGEPDELGSGGNGITGHDETTENLSASWSSNTPADPVVSPPPTGYPEIVSVTQQPEGDPAPGMDVIITARVIDNQAVAHVNISIMIDGGNAQWNQMPNSGGDDYSFTILYGSYALDVGSSVRYNISATDDEGNVTYSDNYTYQYLYNTDPIVIITEVMFDDVDSGDDWIELYCFDDGNGSGGTYLTDWAVDDMDGDHDKIFGNLTVETGDVLLIHYDDDTTPDEMNDNDGNKVINLYADASNTRIKLDGDQVVLYDQDDNIMDAVCWSFNDTFSTDTEIDDMNALFSDGEWDSSENSSCVDSDNVSEGWTISRSKGELDTNSRIDWYVLEVPEPGIFRNLTNDLPAISSVVMDPEPVKDTVLPMNDVTITAKITDEQGILSANITWKLNGTPRSNISLKDDGTGADAVQGDDNWTGVLPGQTEGSVVNLTIKAFDTTLTEGIGELITITYSEPPKTLDILITEVMLDDEDGNDWVEIYCGEDANDGNGFNLSGWNLDDLEDTRYTFGNTVVKTGEYVLVHFDNATGTDELDSSDGNNDNIIDVYTAASNRIMDANGDQIVLFDNEGDPVDVLAWQKSGTLSTGEQADMGNVLAWEQWDSDTNESCVNITTLSKGESITRYRNVISKGYMDGNNKTDWYINPSPTPGFDIAITPFGLALTLLDNAPVSVPVDTELPVTWSIEGHTQLVDLANLSLYYYEDDLNSTGEFIDHLDPGDGEYLWDISGLDEGEYYLQVLVDDTINPPYTVNTSFPLRIVPVLPPEAVSSSPLDNAIGVRVDSDITVTFDMDMDLDSFELYDTFITDPAIAGKFTLTGGVAVVFTPDSDLEYDTTYEITVDGVMSGDGVELEDPYDFSFKTEVHRFYSITGSVEPGNATLKIDGTAVDVTYGEFQALRPNGTYSLIFTAVRYKTETIKVTVDGGNEAVGEIVLDPDVEPEKNDVPMGPFKDSKGKLLEGLDIEFSHGGNVYTPQTGKDGMAVIEDFPLKEIPRDTLIKVTRGIEEKSWRFGTDDLPVFDAKEGDDDDDGGEDSGDKGSNAVLWGIVAILAVMITVVLIAIVVYVLRSKKRESEDEPRPGEAEVGWEGDGGEEEVPVGEGPDVQEEDIAGETEGEIPGDDDAREPAVAEESAQPEGQEEQGLAVVDENAGQISPAMKPVSPRPETQSDAMTVPGENEDQSLESLEGISDEDLLDE